MEVIAAPRIKPVVWIGGSPGPTSLPFPKRLRTRVFQKKSKTGIKTPKREIELIKSRLKRAEEEHARWRGSER